MTGFKGESLDGAQFDDVSLVGADFRKADLSRATATVRRVLADLTDERLAATTEPVLAVGYPESKSFPVTRCLRAIISDEWEHRLFAERDLDALATRSR